MQIIITFTAPFWNIQFYTIYSKSGNNHAQISRDHHLLISILQDEECNVIEMNVFLRLV